MKSFSFIGFAWTDACSGFRRRSESTLSPVAVIDVDGHVVTFGATRVSEWPDSCEKTGKTGIIFVKRSLLITTTNLYIQGVGNTGSCPQKRAHVVTFSAAFSSRKNTASVALPIKSMSAIIQNKHIFAAALWAPSTASTAKDKCLQLFCSRAPNGLPQHTTTSQPSKKE